MRELTQRLRCGRQLLCTCDLINGFPGGEMVADGTDPAQSLHDDRHVPVRTTLDEALEAAELYDMQPRFLDVVIVVGKQCHLAVSFDARQWFDDDALERLPIRCGFQIRCHCVTS